MPHPPLRTLWGNSGFMPVLVGGHCITSKPATTTHAKRRSRWAERFSPKYDMAPSGHHHPRQSTCTACCRFFTSMAYPGHSSYYLLPAWDFFTLPTMFSSLRTFSAPVHASMPASILQHLSSSVLVYCTFSYPFSTTWQAPRTCFGTRMLFTRFCMCGKFLDFWFWGQVLHGMGFGAVRNILSSLTSLCTTLSHYSSLPHPLTSPNLSPCLSSFPTFSCCPFPNKLSSWHVLQTCSLLHISHFVLVNHALPPRQKHLCAFVACTAHAHTSLSSPVSLVPVPF